ncbi:MAG: orotidine-5'-phosphate decarboxylase [Deinococcales bacterium]
MPTLTSSFSERLFDRIVDTDSRICLGIDPRPSAHPLTHPDRFGHDPAQVAKAVVYYFQAIIESTQDIVACYKLQSAFFEVLGVPGLIALAQLLADLKAKDIPVILDAKRSDISSTAEAYAKAYLDKGVFSADALTVNPYLGMDSLAPFVSEAQKQQKQIFVLVKTSNPGSQDFQDLKLADGSLLYEKVADRLHDLGKDKLDSLGYAAIGAVVGATHPEELAKLRQRLPHSLFLVPGYGAQGAGSKDILPAFDEEGFGALISASRSLTYVSREDDFADRAREAAEQMRDEINEVVEEALF